MAIDIHIAKNDADYTAFGALVREYADWCRARFAHEAWMIELAFSHQSLDSELESLAARYGPPGAVPSTEACRDALNTAEEILAGR